MKKQLRNLAFAFLAISIFACQKDQTKTAETAKLIINRHFLKDLRGNLRGFSQQKFRCVACNSKFRRPPLLGKCTNCAGRIIFTVSEGSVIKYLQPMLSLADKYNLPIYLKQTLELLNKRIEEVFGKEKEFFQNIDLNKYAEVVDIYDRKRTEFVKKAIKEVRKLA